MIKQNRLINQTNTQSLVDASWRSWQTWEECSVSCGSGTQWRHRECRPALHGGQDCQGAHNESQLCSTHECPGMHSVQWQYSFLCVELWFPLC